jgi:hypothetical protein
VKLPPTPHPAICFCPSHVRDVHCLMVSLLTRTARAPCRGGRFFRELPGNASSNATTLANISNATDDTCGVCLRCPFTTTADAGSVGSESCVCMPGYARPQLLEDENMTNSTNETSFSTNETSFNETSESFNASIAPPRTGPCVPCLPGAFSDTRNASACTLCPNNTYQEEGASTMCLACPRGSSAMEGAALRTNCSCNDGEVFPPATRSELFTPI